MMSMLRTAVVVAVLAVLLPVSASGAGADARGCMVLTDPSGDYLSLVSTWGVADHPVPGLHAEVDARTLRMDVEGDALRVTLGVQSLSSSSRPTTVYESYNVSWWLDGEYHSVAASRWGDRWTFRADQREASGSVDVERDRIRLRFPLSRMPGADRDSVLSGISVRTSGWEAMVPVAIDAASVRPGELISGRFPLDGRCAPTSEPGRCLAGTDPTGDGGRPDNASTDVDGVELGVDEETVGIGIRVADLRPSLPEWADRERWTAEWRGSSGARYAVEVVREAGGFASALYRTPRAAGFAYSRLELATDTVVVRVPRHLLETRAGDELAGLRARAATEVRRLHTSVDVQGDASEAVDHVAGACELPVEPLRCPVVADPAGDAEPTGAGVGVTSSDAVDLLATGAVSDPDLIRVSVRVPDPTAGPPRGFDTVGWTVSWSTGEADWFAQAERTPDGPRFRYGRKARDPERDEPLGPAFGGRATTGVADPHEGTVAIDVPRHAVEDGEELGRFGAASWVLRSAPSAAAYRVVDETELDAYRAGTTCGA